jgi:hypothetical protein
MRISYVQRTFYQPCTEMVQKTFFEPVTKNVTTFFYEPVTTYRYSTFYDPCTGCPKQVCTPCTSFRLRSQCNAVTSYVQRCAMVPVTTLKPVTVRQPVVSYYFPPQPVCPPPCPPPCPPGGVAAAPSAIPPAIGSTGPSVDELRSNPPTISQDSNIPPQVMPTNPTPGMSYPRPGTQPRLRPEKTTSRTPTVVTVRGEVVQPDRLTPRAGAKVVFVNADRQDVREVATANQYGEFDVRLPAGNWYVYLGTGDGKATYHKQVSLGGKDTYDYRVVSR